MAHSDDSMLIDEMNREVEGDSGQSGSQSKNCGRRDRTRLRRQPLKTAGEKIKIHVVNFSAIRSRDNPLSDVRLLRAARDFSQQAHCTESLCEYERRSASLFS